MSLQEQARQWADASWHAKTFGDAADALGTDLDAGLSGDDVEDRRDVCGDNELPRREPPGLLRVIARQLHDPLVYILLVAAVVSLVTGSLNNAIFIFAVLLLNTTVGTVQEHRAEQSASSLQGAVDLEARAVRDGEERRIPAVELVPGDIVRVESGDAIPADLRLRTAEELDVDESLLTGESEPVTKDAEASIDEDAAVGDRLTLAHAGSLVQRGRGEGVVCRIGAETELGRIAASLSEGERQVPPLVLRLNRLTRVIAIFVLAAVALLAGVQWSRGSGWLEIFFLTVALAVSAIPAGLPVAITVALAVASRRMAKRNVIVRQLPAVEGLGACTLIASDKTGTLTENVLTVKRLAWPEGQAEVEGEGYSPEGAIEPRGNLDDADARVTALVEAGARCNWAHLNRDGDEVAPEGDGVDVALRVLAEKAGVGRPDDEPCATIPFASDRRYAAVFYRDGDEVIATVKGAVEVVLPMCASVEGVESLENDLAEEGFRVLALASGPVDLDEDAPEESLTGLELVGLVGLIDPVRGDVPEALQGCRDAGVGVRMVTGDHPATGLAIARQVGIAGDDDHAVTGRELAEGGDVDAAVFARVEPIQKTEIVQALQDEGHFVAVTGDGANDAPALRDAHIGVAMGEGGTDVARGAADLILTDDNFASIVAGVEEGRVAYDNVRKVVWLLLATGAAEVLLFFLAMAFGMEIPLLPVQLLWLNLVTNGIQDVALAFEKGEPDTLNKPPRDPDEPIVDRSMLEQVALSGAYMGIVAFAVYRYLVVSLGMDVPAARNLVLLLMVLFENVHIFSCRSERRSAFRVSLLDNPLLIVTVVLAQGAHIASMFIPGLSDVLAIEPVSFETWAILAPIAVTLLLFDEAIKLVRRHLAEGGEPAGAAA